MLYKLILNLSIEFGPIIAFLIASEFLAFFPAVSIFVMLTVLAMIAGQIERKSFAWFPFIVGISIIITGSLTVVLKDPFYIIIKDTVYNGLFAIVLMVGLYYKKSLLKDCFR